MIYGYLRVSTDKQDIDSQRQGVDGFAEAKGWKYSAKPRPTGRERAQKYKDGTYKIVPLDRAETLALIQEDKTIPQIAEAFGEYTYEQVYDTILCDEEFNTEYRKHGQKLVKREHY